MTLREWDIQIAYAEAQLTIMKLARQRTAEQEQKEKRDALSHT